MIHNETQCAKPSFIFGNLDNLLNCYHDFGGHANTNAFTRAVGQCLNDYCAHKSAELKGCGKWSGPTKLDFSVTANSSTFMGYTSFNNEETCADVAGEVNSDIAGPGVFCSYIMQLSMIVYLWFFLRLHHLGPSMVAYLLKRNKKHPEARKRSQRRERFLIRHLAVLKHTLVEFQEAQCFFMLASQAAILWATYQKNAFGSSTLRSLLINSGVAGMVSSTGILPVVMGMWSLQKMHENPPWIMGLSTITIVVSEVALYATREAPPVSQIVRNNHNNWPDTCGFLAPPLIFCGTSTETDTTLVFTRGGSISFSQIWNPYCLAVFGVVILFWIKTNTLGPTPSWHSRTSPLLNIEELRRSGWEPRIKFGLGALTFVIELVFIAAMAMEFSFFTGFNLINVIDWNDWSFGQIVAITLWFPIVIKYIYWLIFGTEQYSKARIPGPYKIIKQLDEKGEGVSNIFVKS